MNYGIGTTVRSLTGSKKNWWPFCGDKSRTFLSIALNGTFECFIPIRDLEIQRKETNRMIEVNNSMWVVTILSLVEILFRASFCFSAIENRNSFIK